MYKVTYDAHEIFNTEKDIANFKKRLKKEVIETALDDPLEQSLKELKSSLFFLINEAARTEKVIVAPTEGIEEEKINIPKSEESILKYLFNVDINKYKDIKDYSTLNDCNIIFGYNSRNSKDSNRITLRLDIDPQDTIESQYQKAKEIFQNCVLALPNESGQLEYFINTGEDIEKGLKIKCSVSRGTHDLEPTQRSGMSPYERFERDKTRNRADGTNYAEWTLKQDFVNDIRKGNTKFKNLNEIINSIKEGKFEEANIIFKKFKNYDNYQEVEEKIKDIGKEKGSIPADSKAYLNVITLINNLRIKKEISKLATFYYLTSVYAGTEEEIQNFLPIIERNITDWIAVNSDIWFSKFLKAVERLLIRIGKKS